MYVYLYQHDEELIALIISHFIDKVYLIPNSWSRQNE